MNGARINQVWYRLDRMSELTEYLQSMPSHELTKRVASQISQENIPTMNPRRITIENFIVLIKQFMADFYGEIKTELERHAYNYPFIQRRLPFIRYDLTESRDNYQKIQRFLRKTPLRYRYIPREIKNAVVPIVLPGVDYSAESLVYSGSLQGENFPDKSRLGWQHLDAYADYCLGVMALGRETYGALVDGWYYSIDSDLYFKSLETVAEEMLHHVSDEIAGPRYDEHHVSREHYWMKSYGEFPEKVDIALLRLKDEYLGRLKQNLSLQPINNAELAH